MFTFEDPTGTITVIINPGRKPELSLTISELVEDAVVIVDGFLNMGGDRGRVVFANKIAFPDVPQHNYDHFPDVDLSLCLISDTHFASNGFNAGAWNHFIQYLRGELGTDAQRNDAGKIKYLLIAGDLVDGIGVFPRQENYLSVADIYKQYELAAQLCADIPDYIQVVFIPGDHDAARKALPRATLAKKYAQPLLDLGWKCVGDPALVSCHGVKCLMDHGQSIIDMAMSVPGLAIERPQEIIKYFLKYRTLVPSYGKKTELAPGEEDHLVIEQIPDILFMGHTHTCGIGTHNGVLCVDSGTFQEQTDFMKSLGIIPDVGKPTVVNFSRRTLKSKIVDLIN
jgi:DNA polymerase II small subunit